MREEKEAPLVSIVCTAYNHEDYIKNALEGFVTQRTTFPFEIIVHDDASTDSTAGIIKEYEQKYPHLFFNIYQKENQYSKGINIWANIFQNYCRGKYIAICEGDDYWVDPDKLEKQVSYLETNKEIVLSFHRVYLLNNNNSFSLSKLPPKKVLTQHDLAKTNYINTCSVVFRNIVSSLDLNILVKSRVSDYILWMLLTEWGNLHYTDENMACYRVISSGSIWSAKSSLYQYINWIDTLKILIKHFRRKTRLLLFYQMIVCYLIVICKYLIRVCGGKK